VGAIAVVVTLLYLARETGKNAKAVDATSSREVAFRISEWHRDAAKDPELRRIITKGLGTELCEFATPEEAYEFHATALSLFTIYQAQFMHRAFKVGHEDEVDLYVSVARGVIQFPTFRRWWDDVTAAGGFNAEFVRAVEAAEEVDLSFVPEPKPAG
jgi:hypothetical protein